MGEMLRRQRDEFESRESALLTHLELKENALRKLTRRLLEIQDQEGRRIAQDLHDTTVQHLVVLQMNLESLRRFGEGQPAAYAKTLRQCLALTGEATRELRTLSYLLSPPLLETVGLKAALRDLAREFERRSGVEVTLVLPERFARLPREAELALYRVVQEGMVNIQRHSGSKTACICLHPVRGGICLEVSDRGRGISRRKFEQLRNGVDLGVGLAGMRERLGLLGGELELSSSQRGVTVRATLPLTKPL